MVIFLLVLIAIIDLYRHRIPNLLLAILAVSIFLNGDFSFRPGYAISVLLISVVGYWGFGVGAGDVKLLLLIALFLTPADESMGYWVSFSIIGSLHILLRWCTNQSLRGNIALAPSLCGAVLYISLLSHF